ncbi:MAG: ORF6N domain-containing protein [Saprospiraceae bacterium]|jgi:hypothetical protein
MDKDRSIVPEELIIRRIVTLREEKILLDLHLAELYGVETRALKQAVKRNAERFPSDFMFELTDLEIDQVVSQNVIPSKSYLGGAKPFAFTEIGVAMLSSVLRSQKAIDMNILIMRIFVALRKIAINYKELLTKLEEMENTYDNKFSEIYKTLKHFINTKSQRREIGFKKES